MKRGATQLMDSFAIVMKASMALTGRRRKQDAEDLYRAAAKRLNEAVAEFLTQRANQDEET